MIQLWLHLLFYPGAQANAGEGVTLEDYQGDKVNLDSIKAVSECIQLASNPDIVGDMEDIASVWCKQIEQVRERKDHIFWTTSLKLIESWELHMIAFRV